MSARISSPGRLRLLATGVIALTSGGPAVTMPVDPTGPSATAIVAPTVTADRIYQRNGTSKTITIAGTYTGTASLIQARVVNAADNSQVTAWATLDAAPAGGNYSGSIVVPQGGWYKWQVRDGVNNAVNATSTNQFGVGILVALIGQSNMRFLSEQVVDYPISSGKTRRFASGAWARIGNYNDALAPSTPFSVYGSNRTDVPGDRGDGVVYFANLLQASLGIPVGTFEYAVTGSSIERWLVGGNCWTPFAAAVAAAGGDLEMAIWLQGEDNTGTSMTTYKNNLGILLTNLRALGSRTASTFHMGVVCLGPSRDYFGAEGNGGLVRKTQLEFVAENGNNSVFFAGTAHDANLFTDNVHFINQARQGRRYALGAQRRLAGGAQGVTGPRITSATRSGATITVNITQASGTVLRDGAGGTGSAQLGWRVFDNGVQMAAPSTAIAGNTVVLTLATTPSGPVTLDYAMTNMPFGNTTAPASVVVDNDTVPGDTGGLPLQPCTLITVTGS